jgi:GNAT superfamily N-acetyltransferase
LVQRRIEESALNAWPALQQTLYDGWILRFSSGYTKRANSVNPLYPPTIDVGKKVSFCETCYAEHGLPAIFRITPYAPEDLDQTLAAHGYERIDTTLVLHLALDRKEGAIFKANAPEKIHAHTLDDWLAIFCQLKSAQLDTHQTHREILTAIPGKCHFASLAVAGQAVSCALGVLEGAFFGLFDVVTAPGHRNKGYGTSLLTAMLAWASKNGAQHAYLGVVKVNSPARHLYDKLGFRELYRYWYRIPGEEG